MTTITVTTEYAYQAWQQARAALRSNVELVGREPGGRDRDHYTFRAIDTERWPVAARHFLTEAKDWIRVAHALRRAGSVDQEVYSWQQVRRALIQLWDAQTGCVTDPDTLLPVV